VKQNEIFVRLMAWKQRQLFDDATDEEYVGAVLWDIARALDLTGEQAAALAGDEVPDDLITITEAANMLRVSTQAISGRIARGELAAYTDSSATNPTHARRVSRRVVRNAISEKYAEFPQVDQKVIGQKVAGDETHYRVITVHGSDAAGYVAFHEDWFGFGDMEFYGIRAHSDIHDTPDEAMDSIAEDARQQADDDGFGEPEQTPTLRLQYSVPSSQGVTWLDNDTTNF